MQPAEGLNPHQIQAITACLNFLFFSFFKEGKKNKKPPYKAGLFVCSAFLNIICLLCLHTHEYLCTLQLYNHVNEVDKALCAIKQINC